jgi:hypothetical protein
MEQLKLHLPPIVAVGEKSSMQLRFEAFHLENPHVLYAIVTVAFFLKDKGFKRAGMKMIFERLRWEYAIKTKGEEEYKLNNNYTSYYARLVMCLEPELAGFFRLRGMREDYEPDLAALGLEDYQPRPQKK